MAKRAPGKHYRKGMTLLELYNKFPTDEAAEEWFIETRWPNGIACPLCGSMSVQQRTTHPTMPFRCRDCKRFFSVKTGSCMHASNLGYRTWAIAIYLMNTGIKGTSSLKLHRDLGITQKAAWHLSHRIRESWNKQNARFTGPAEVDETYIGGKEKNKHASEKLNAGRGAVGKVPVVGMKDRSSNKVSAAVARGTDRRTLRRFIAVHLTPGAEIFSDDYPAYKGLRNHKAVKHSVGQYVQDQAHTNGIESFWALLKRGYYGTYHQMSPKHLQRYVDEFAGRHNARSMDTTEQMQGVARGMDQKRLRYKDLVR